MTCEHPWFNLLRIDVNGPSTANTAAAHHADDDPGAKFKRPPKKACAPTIASGTWIELSAAFVSSQIQRLP